MCQTQCFLSACEYDRGDCEVSLCASGCYSDMQGDSVCQQECYTPACQWDLTDCDCAPGCPADLIGDGMHPIDRWTDTVTRAATLRIAPGMPLTVDVRLAVSTPTSAHASLNFSLKLTIPINRFTRFCETIPKLPANRDALNLSWPDLVLQLFNSLEASGRFPEFLFSFKCLYDETELESYKRQLIVLSLLEPTLVALSTCIWLAVGAYHHSLSSVKNQLVNSGIVVYFSAQCGESADE